MPKYDECGIYDRACREGTCSHTTFMENAASGDQNQVKGSGGKDTPMIIELKKVDVDRLKSWLLEGPSGALTTDTDMRHVPQQGIVFEAVEGGGVLVRVCPR